LIALLGETTNIQLSRVQRIDPVLERLVAAHKKCPIAGGEGQVNEIHGGDPIGHLFIKGNRAHSVVDELTIAIARYDITLKLGCYLLVNAFSVPGFAEVGE
jgi:hypothetical protein